MLRLPQSVGLCPQGVPRTIGPGGGAEGLGEGTEGMQASTALGTRGNTGDEVHCKYCLSDLVEGVVAVS